MLLKRIILTLFLAVSLLPIKSFAQDEFVGKIIKGEVLEIVSETEEEDFFKGTPIKIQNLKVLDVKTNEIVFVHNDFRAVSVGQKIFYSVNDLGGGEYSNI